MLEKRSFGIGFLTSAYAMHCAGDSLTDMVNEQCRLLNMTPLSEAETAESAAFMEYMANLMTKRRVLQ